MSAFDFWYQGLGQYLHPEGSDPITALSRNHPHRTTPGSAMRLGGGKAMSLITSDGATLMADIKPARMIPDSVKVMGGDWRSIPNWTADLIVNPPVPPFLIVIHGKDWDTAWNWQISHSQDVIYIGGADPTVINRQPVIVGLAAVDGIPAAQWKFAARLMEHRKRNPGDAKAIDRQIEAVIAKFPAVDEALEHIPQIGTPEFDALSLITSVREKESKTSASKAGKDAA